MSTTPPISAPSPIALEVPQKSPALGSASKPPAKLAENAPGATVSAFEKRNGETLIDYGLFYEALHAVGAF